MAPRSWQTVFSRVDVKSVKDEGGHVFEVPQVHWVNPRQLHRRLVRLAEESGYTIEPDDTSFQITKEAIGEKSGVVEARIAASKRVPGIIRFKTRPYRTMGIVLLILGILVVPGGLLLAGAMRWLLVGLGIIMLAAGGYLMFHRRGAFMEAYARARFRVLIEGEVTERTITREGATVTNLLAQLALTAGAQVVHQADGSLAPSADRDGFRETFAAAMPLDVPPFAEVAAVESPFWDSLDKGIRRNWKQLERTAIKDFAKLRGELEQVTGNVYDVSPAATVDPIMHKEEHADDEMPGSGRAAHDAPADAPAVEPDEAPEEPDDGVVLPSFPTK